MSSILQNTYEAQYIPLQKDLGQAKCVNWAAVSLGKNSSQIVHVLFWKMQYFEDKAIKRKWMCEQFAFIDKWDK